MRVIIDASNITANGPRAVVRGLLPPLLRQAGQDKCYVLLPDELRDEELARLDANTVALPPPRWRSNNLIRLDRLYRDLPALARRLQPDVWLTLGDLGPLNLPCAHVALLHMGYLVYSPEEMHGISDWGWLKDRYLRWHFRKTVDRMAAVIVQTSVMGARLIQRFGMAPEKVHVVPQPLSAHVTSTVQSAAPRALVEDERPVRLLFLAAGAGHKNHSVVPRVVKVLKARGLANRVRIYVTLAADHPILAGLDGDASEVVRNLGTVKPDQVVATLRAATALFLPTLVESYGLVYLEAMACGRPILTSDRDFARGMCGDLALYFEPTEPESIVNTMAQHLADSAPSGWEARCRERLALFPANWDIVAARFWTVLRNGAAGASVSHRAQDKR